MSTKNKLSIITMTILLTLVFGILSVKKEPFSVSESLLKARNLIFSEFIVHFTGDEYAKYDDQVHFLNRVESLHQLENESNVIAEVETISRVMIGEYVKTKCKVHKVIKSEEGNVALQEIIYVYEHYRMNPKSEDAFISLGSPVYPMRDGQRYLVFLNVIDAYEKKNQFNFSSSVFGIIPIKNTIEIKKSPRFSQGESKFPIENFNSSDYIVDPMTDETIEEINDNIKQDLIALAMNSEKMSSSEYKSQHDEIIDLQMSIPFALSYEFRLKEIVRESLLKYYDIEVEFVD